MEKKHSRGLRELPKALLSRKRYDDDSERSETEFSDLERGRSITGTKGKKRVEGCSPFGFDALHSPAVSPSPLKGNL